ncbi:MAG: HAD-IA family hydrolase [Bacteroidales bacterium]|nr:HAD-IA family hydrolase [Bacteroidales bacterium]
MAIKNLIFDLGGVWLPIDEKRTLAAFAALAGAHSGTAANAAATVAAQALAARLQPDVLTYELGAINDATLLTRLRNALTAAKTAGSPEAQAAGQPATETAKAAANAPHATETLTDDALIQAWNAMLLPFPEAHLPLLDAYGQRYRLFLLSNTNALHIRYVEQDFQSRFPGRKPFLQHFEQAYLSHELHLRKPQPEIYTHVLRDAALRPEETLFIDDRAENIAAAATLGIRTHLHPANTPLTDLQL